MGSVPGSNAQDTWRQAIRTYESRFTPEDLVEIKKTTKPDDLLSFIKNLEVKDDKSNVSKIARRIGKLADYFNSYEQSLDMITQGLPSPGCLVWGSIKFVLAVSASESPNGKFFREYYFVLGLLLHFFWILFNMSVC